MPEKKGVVLNPDNDWHFIDHLNVIAHIMDIPFLMKSEEQVHFTTTYYPGVDARMATGTDYQADQIALHYDVLFLSDLHTDDWFANYLRPLEKFFHKEIRVVHCPHGFSDKDFFLKRTAFEDVTLIYGDKMLDMLHLHRFYHLLQSYAVTGNYRYTYFKQHRTFYEQVVETEILSRFATRQPLILYAPTWDDARHSTTFFEAADTILKQLPDHYNLLFKLHPSIKRYYPAKIDALIALWGGKPNIYFLPQYPLVYPLLAYTDIFISDHSSVGYDFLPFNKPMFFLTKSSSKQPLQRCGVVIDTDEYANLYHIIERSLPGDGNRFSKVRKETYDYAFGPEKSFASIKMDIQKAYQTPNPLHRKSLP